MKVGDHHFIRRGNPDDDRVAEAAAIELLQGASLLAYRDFDRYGILEKKICYYTMSDDEGFVVKRIGPRAFLQSACSGHGFKLGPWIGSGVAAAIDGAWEEDVLATWAAGQADEERRLSR